MSLSIINYLTFKNYKEQFFNRIEISLAYIYKIDKDNIIINFLIRDPGQIMLEIITEYRHYQLSV